MILLFSFSVGFLHLFILSPHILMKNLYSKALIYYHYLKRNGFNSWIFLFAQSYRLNFSSIFICHSTGTLNLKFIFRFQYFISTSSVIDLFIILSVLLPSFQEGEVKNIFLSLSRIFRITKCMRIVKNNIKASENDVTREIRIWINKLDKLLQLH